MTMVLVGVARQGAFGAQAIKDLLAQDGTTSRRTAGSAGLQPWQRAGGRRVQFGVPPNCGSVRPTGTRLQLTECVRQQSVPGATLETTGEMRCYRNFLGPRTRSLHLLFPAG
jgi:hypothetical protein